MFALIILKFNQRGLFIDKIVQNVQLECKQCKSCSRSAPCAKAYLSENIDHYSIPAFQVKSHFIVRRNIVKLCFSQGILRERYFHAVKAS